MFSCRREKHITSQTGRRSYKHKIYYSQSFKLPNSSLGSHLPTSIYPLYCRSFHIPDRANLAAVGTLNMPLLTREQRAAAVRRASQSRPTTRGRTNQKESKYCQTSGDDGADRANPSTSFDAVPEARAFGTETRDARDYQAKSSHDHTSIYSEPDGVDSSGISYNVVMREPKICSMSGYDGRGYRSGYDNNYSRDESKSNTAREPNSDVCLSHYQPLSRTNYDQTYNPGIGDAMKALDIIIIGFHFSLRGYSKTADAITELLIRIFKAKVGDFASRDDNKISYHEWLSEDERGCSFWAFQRDPAKSIHDVRNPEGWWNWALLKDCERKLGLLDYRSELMEKYPNDWPHLTGGVSS